MDLKALGYNKQIEDFFKSEGVARQEVGRVVVEHKERYIVRTEATEYEAEITGNLRFSAQSRSDFPAVGDWVSLSAYDANLAVIIGIYPRRTVLERQAVGKYGDKQIIASNVDFAFIMQAINNDFNLNRIDRYLTICNATSIKPIIILSKIDLLSAENVQQITSQLKARVKDIPIVLISNQTMTGYTQLRTYLSKGNTYCILGSSGVGKSSLINNLLGQQLMGTNSTSQSTKKGRHTTTHRELFVLESGGILIDTPGMRELGVTESDQSVETTFDTISSLAENCKFKDCSHTEEAGCAVIEAIKSGSIDQGLLENYQKLKREQERFQISIHEKREKDKKQGKSYKSIQQFRRKNKY